MVDDMYKIGTRVKKVYGTQIGITGVVCNGPNVVGKWLEDGMDIFVAIDQAWDDASSVARFPPGSVGSTKSILWEPIIPDGSDVPAEVSFHELLDPAFYEQTQPLYAPA